MLAAPPVPGQVFHQLLRLLRVMIDLRVAPAPVVTSSSSSKSCDSAAASVWLDLKIARERLTVLFGVLIESLRLLSNPSSLLVLPASPIERTQSITESIQQILRCSSVLLRGTFIPSPQQAIAIASI